MKIRNALCAAALILAGCAAPQKAETKETSFKTEYEALNGKTNKEGREHRTIEIPDDNPFVITTGEDIVKKVDDKETFYVYFGDPMCPWCRSVIEELCKVAKKEDIQTIYAVDIWDEEGNEIFRNKYELKDGELKETVKGTDAYYTLVKDFDNVLKDYSVKDKNGTSYAVEQKRIFAPDLVAVKDGRAAAMAQGISEKQEDSRQELTDEIRQDEDNLFKEFFEETK